MSGSRGSRLPAPANELSRVLEQDLAMPLDQFEGLLLFAEVLEGVSAQGGAEKRAGESYGKRGRRRVSLYVHEGRPRLGVHVGGHESPGGGSFSWPQSERELTPAGRRRQPRGRPPGHESGASACRSRVDHRQGLPYPHDRRTLPAGDRPAAIPALAVGARLILHLRSLLLPSARARCPRPPNFDPRPALRTLATITACPTSTTTSRTTKRSPTHHR